MTELRDTPAAPPFVPALEPPSPDPVTALHEVAEYEVDVAWHDGYQRALLDVAVGQVELDDAWLPLARKTHEERVRERIAETTATANAQHAQYGTTEWAGLENGAALPTADWTWGQPGGDV